MAMVSYHQIFVSCSLAPPNYKFTRRPRNLFSCRCLKDDTSRNVQKQLEKLAVITLAAGVLTLGSVGDAFAAKSGGRIGGQAFRSSAPRSAPRVGGNSRTNIFINPPVAPPLIGGYGYGYGWSPFSFFVPGPTVAVGFGGGFEVLLFFMFMGAVGAVFRRIFGSRDIDDDY